MVRAIRIRIVVWFRSVSFSDAYLGVSPFPFVCVDFLCTAMSCGQLSRLTMACVVAVYSRVELGDESHHGVHLLASAVVPRVPHDGEDASGAEKTNRRARRLERGLGSVTTDLSLPTPGR